MRNLPASCTWVRWAPENPSTRSCGFSTMAARTAWGSSTLSVRSQMPASWSRYSATPLAQQTPLHRGVRGAMAFLKDGRELDALLLTLEAKPDLQSAFGHYGGYWFQQLGIRVSGIIMAVIETFRDQVGTASDAEEAQLVEKTRADMNLAQDSMLRLTSGIYSCCARTALAQPRRTEDRASVNAIPPMTRPPDTANRSEIGSIRKITPPAAARTGTANCSTAARAALSPRSAAYQTMYPKPDVTAPETTASSTPRIDT